MKQTFSLIQIAPIRDVNILKLFLTSAASRLNIFSINGMIVMISWIAFDRPDSLSHLRAFPDHFKIYSILPIVRIELNSIQATDRGHLSHLGHSPSSGSVFI